MTELLDNIRSRIEALGMGFQFVKTVKTVSRCLSPLRIADIGDMIVEVDSRCLDEDAPSLEQAVLSLKQGLFTLPTEDEYEYLCNGGTQTLFRWGDTLSGVMTEIFQVGTVGETGGSTYEKYHLCDEGFVPKLF